LSDRAIAVLMSEIWQTERVIGHSLRLMECYRRLLGRELLPDLPVGLDGAARSRALFEAPFCVVSHGPQANPILNYGNRYALDLWELDWETWLRTPSRQTAEPDRREERERLLAQVRDRGYVEGYSGIRVSATGRRFVIENVTVWNLTDQDGQPCGQAATYATYRRLD
jgi:hypothetical protein